MTRDPTIHSCSAAHPPSLQHALLSQQLRTANHRPLGWDPLASLAFCWRPFPHSPINPIPIPLPSVSESTCLFPSCQTTRHSNSPSSAAVPYITTTAAFLSAVCGPHFCAPIPRRRRLAVLPSAACATATPHSEQSARHPQDSNLLHPSSRLKDTTTDSRTDSYSEKSRFFTAVVAAVIWTFSARVVAFRRISSAASIAALPGTAFSRLSRQCEPRLHPATTTPVVSW